MAELNPLERARQRFVAQNGALIDLTNSGFVGAGITLSESVYREIWELWRADTRYEQSGRGGYAARGAVSTYYRSRNEDVDPENIILTAGSSVSYHLLFTLIRDGVAGTGDGPISVALPLPGYPLFEDLARDAGVGVRWYDCLPEDSFLPRVGEVERVLAAGARAVVLISPNNPTGVVVPPELRDSIAAACHSYGALLIVDEVFREFVREFVRGDGHESRRDLSDDPATPVFPERPTPLLIQLNGLSKIAAAPELKLGWIAIRGGESAERNRWSDALEIRHDTYLTVSGYAEAAGRYLLGTRAGDDALAAIRRSVDGCVERLERFLGRFPCFEDPLVETNRDGIRTVGRGGIHCILRLDPTVAAHRFGTVDDEEIAVRILKESGVLLHPGYLYGIDEREFAPGPWFVITALHSERDLSTAADRLHRVLC